MVIEKILGALDGTETGVDFVDIEWFEAGKRIMKKTSRGDAEIGLRLSEPLKDGDILFNDGKTIIAVNIMPCELVSISVASMREMGRLCFEIGNRHLSLAISDGNVKIPYDEPTYLYLKKLGFDAKMVVEKFTDFTECKAHGHSHHSVGESAGHEHH